MSIQERYNLGSIESQVPYQKNDIKKNQNELAKLLKLAKELITSNSSQPVTFTTLQVSLADHMPIQKAIDVAKIYFKRATNK